MSRQLEPGNPAKALAVTALFFGGIVLLVIAPFIGYTMCRIEVPAQYMAVLITKTGEDLPNAEEIAPSEKYKGVQPKVLAEGRHFYNPWFYDWDVVSQVNVPEGKLGVRVRLYGDDLGYGEILAKTESQKGIIPEVLRPGRYAINAWVMGSPPRRRNNYAEIVELHDPVVISAGFRGVVTNLSGPMPQKPNDLLVEKGTRGVQPDVLGEGTYYINPYLTRINLVDCRSQRFNLISDGEMGFPSRDGFWVTLDGVIEFRVKPDEAARLFVLYNDAANDVGRDARVDEEIISEIILPNARSFCRLKGSDHSGKEFISGDTRTQFQQEFQDALKDACEPQGVEIIQALITRINPPQKIAEPVRMRQVAVESAKQFKKEMEQKVSEQKLAIENEQVKRKQAIVEADREVVKITTAAMQKQEVALIEAKQRLAVAELELKAALDLAAATLARGKADAEVIEFDNQAEAAGWKKAVEAFGGDGNEYARWVMFRKLAPSFRQMMVNTADSPIMDIFRQYSDSKDPKEKEKAKK